MPATGWILLAILIVLVPWLLTHSNDDREPRP